MPGPDRLRYVADAFRAGLTRDEVHRASRIDPWFLAQIEDLVREEAAIEAGGAAALDAARLRALKRKGFADSRIAKLAGTSEQAVRERRHGFGIRPVFKRVDTCAAEFATSTAYLYSTYEEECEAAPTSRRKIVILGGGPNRIGQGIEFDYCCVHAALALREDGFETIMVNCNPETVSTDYDTSDRLYFEPLTFEDVMEVLHVEQPLGVIVQYGGQTPLKLAKPLEAAGVPIIGTSPDSIDVAEDRERFQKLVDRLRAAPAAEPHGAHRGGGDQARPRGRFSAGGAAVLRARRARDGGGLLGGRPARVHDDGGAGLARQPGAARPLPRPRDRGRRGRGLRRQGRLHRRNHGARRAGGRALGRFRLLAAAEQPERRAAGGDPRADPTPGAGAQRRRAHERAVRDPERHRLRARGQPARVAHRAVRLQGDRRAARQGRRPRDDGQDRWSSSGSRASACRDSSR